MDVNPILAKHLREARRELVAQRETLDADIRNIDILLKGGTPTVSVKPTIGMDVRGGDGRSNPPEDAREGSVRPTTAADGSADTVKEHLVDKRVRDLYLGKSGPGPYQGTSMRLAIIHYLQQAGQPMSTQQIAEDLADQHGWAKSSVRSLLSRLASDHIIVLVRRGLYATRDTLPVGWQIGGGDVQVSLEVETIKDELTPTSAADEAEMRLA